MVVLNRIEISGPDLALLGQRAENHFVGVNCGIMDQFISANGRAGHALFLDCRDLSFELVPLFGDDVQIVICNSGVTRGLTDSAYNDRRSACESGVSLLARAMEDGIYGHCAMCRWRCWMCTVMRYRRLF